MTLKVSDSHSDNYPTRWRDFDKHLPGPPPGAFGFRTNYGEINRWAARYRAAASYVAIELKDYQSRETVEGYSALIRATLVWSAFERYLPIVGLDQRSCDDFLARYKSEPVARSVAEIDEGAKLYSYIRERVTNPSLTQELDKYFQGNPCNISYLLSAIRHIFGHGHLTPASNETSAVVTKQICDVLSDFHLNVMDDDFSRHVEEFEEMIDRVHEQ